MAEAENCRGECGGGLLVEITGGETQKTGLLRRAFLRAAAVPIRGNSPLCPTPVRPW